MTVSVAIIFVAAVIFLSILAGHFSDRFGMPVLILFMFIGMLFGSDGIFKIPFNDFHLAEIICEAALLFIMFYGGFNTKWGPAKKVAGKSVVLSTFGVLITTGITAALCYAALGFSVTESFLIGAVLSSTDAASVFSILRQNKLSLKYGTASLLEIESGSNDPMSYMLTLVAIQIVQTGAADGVALLFLKQLGFGVGIGVGFALISVWALTKSNLIADGADTIFMIASVLMCYGLTVYLGGNQFLSVYLMGIIIGNRQIRNKPLLVHFFDGVTKLAQILIFFLLGLLTFPHLMPRVALPALAIIIFLTLIARPAATFALLLPFRCSVRQCLLISWAGLRGAASSVFAIIAVANGVETSYDLFHIVFMVSLFSAAIQGTLLPRVAAYLDMIDESEDVRKTFNDYQEESAITLMRMYIPEGHEWADRLIKDVTMPTNSLALMIKRGKKTIITKGNTMVRAGDTVILSVPAYEPAENEKLEEIVIDSAHPWCNKTIAELHLSPNELIAIIIRDSENLIPDGKTQILDEDIVVLYK